MRSKDLYFTVTSITLTLFLLSLTNLSHATVNTKSSTSPLDHNVIAISIDNDLFVPSSTDRDYTAGFAVTYSGPSANQFWGAPDHYLGVIDKLFQKKETGYITSSYVPSLEVGGYGFTPDDINAKVTYDNDRPYASLVYLSTGRTYYAAQNRSAWTTSLALGFLGLDIFKAGQNRVHDVIGSDMANGWRHQISEGGEPTFRYQRAYHQYWNTSSDSAHYKTTYFGSVGYLTEAGIAITTRHGAISSPDYRFNPELISYGERTGELVPPSYGDSESYFWGGLAAKLRLYNVFLQGQFRHSDHTLNRSELRPLIIDAWLGYTKSFGREFQFSYILRGNTSEINNGYGDRPMLWGGFVISHKI